VNNEDYSTFNTKTNPSISLRSLGVSFYQICTGYIPFISNKIIGGQYIINKPTPDLPDEFHEYKYLFKK
jgi:hypothetical protein